LEVKQFGIRHQGFLIFGIILLVIGLVAYFYVEVEVTKTEVYPGYFLTHSRKEYPYQGISTILIIAGIILTALGFVYPLQKKEM
jgi:uncharacterized membrane protein